MPANYPTEKYAAQLPVTHERPQAPVDGGRQPTRLRDAFPGSMTYGIRSPLGHRDVVLAVQCASRSPR